MTRSFVYEIALMRKGKLRYIAVSGEAHFHYDEFLRPGQRWSAELEIEKAYDIDDDGNATEIDFEKLDYETQREIKDDIREKVLDNEPDDNISDYTSGKKLLTAVFNDFSEIFGKEQTV